VIEWIRSLDPAVVVAIVGLATFDVLVLGAAARGLWRRRRSR
jgi:hypothetical protein